MPAFKLLAAVAVLSSAIPAPSRAQQAMSEPAYCAFYYPYANCQNKGPGNPYTDPNYRRGPVWPGAETVGVATRRQHRSSAMRMQ